MISYYGQLLSKPQIAYDWPQQYMYTHTCMCVFVCVCVCVWSGEFVLAHFQYVIQCTRHLDRCKILCYLGNIASLWRDREQFIHVTTASIEDHRLLLSQHRSSWEISHYYCWVDSNKSIHKRYVGQTIETSPLPPHSNTLQPHPPSSRCLPLPCTSIGDVSCALVLIV